MITLTTDSGGHAADELDGLLARIGDDVEFLIVERDDAPGFAQAIGGPGGYTVEHKDASNELWQATTPDLAVARQVLVGWAQDAPGWRGLLTWSSLGTF